MTDTLRRTTQFFAFTILLLGLLLAGSDEAHAQVEPEPEAVNGAQPTLTLGARVGYGITDVHGDAIHTSHAGARPMVGVFFNYALTDRLVLQPEVVYNPRTVRVSSTEQPLPNSDEYGPAHLWRYSMETLEVPILLKGYLAVPEVGRLHIFAGPDLAINLNNSVRHAQSTAQEMLPPFGEQFRQTDVGLVFGGGVDHFVAGRMISLDVRYNLGLTDMVDEPNRSSLYRRGFDVTIGVGL